MKLNDQQLTELKALADAATPGPWWSGECVPADGHALAWLGNMFVDCNGGQKNYAEPSHDAEFIAASREAIPALIADLKEVQRELENERARGIHSCHDNCTQDGCVNRRLREELNTTRKQLAEAQALLVSGADLLGKVAMNAVDDFVCASGQKYANPMRQEAR